MLRVNLTRRQGALLDQASIPPLPPRLITYRISSCRLSSCYQQGQRARVRTAATSQQHSHRSLPTIGDHTGNGSNRINLGTCGGDVGLRRGGAPHTNFGGGAAIPPPVLLRNAVSAAEPTRASLIGESGTIRSGIGGKASGEAIIPQCPLQSASDDEPEKKPTAEEEGLGRTDSFTSAWLGLVSREADLSFVPEEMRVSHASSVVCVFRAYLL